MKPLAKSSQDLTKNPVLQAFIQDQTKSPQTFKADICEEDEMYLYSVQNLKGDSERARVRYYSLGRRIRDAVKQVVDWHFQGFENVSSFLDFASGYGRLTRFLIQEMPAEKVWVSDIYAGAVKFQTEYFGVQGIVSTSQPENYQVEKKFDCILASSFFSHMPEKTFANWLQTLYDLLTPGGLLMFSVHDEYLLPSHVEMDAKGIVFSPQSESRSLEGEEYGTTYVSEQFVREMINKVSGGQAVTHRIKQGICRFQDLYVVTNQPRRDFSRFNFCHHPDGHVDVAYFTPLNRFHLEGWAADFNQEGRIEEIQVLVNGEILQRCRPFYNRPDIAELLEDKATLLAGWSCYLPKTVSPEAVVMIKTISNYGWEWVMETSTLESLVKNKRSDSERFSTEAKLERLQARLGDTQKELENFQSQLVSTQKDWEESQLKLAASQSEMREVQAQLAATEIQLQESQAQLLRVQREWEQSQTQLLSAQVEGERARSRIVAMESSKFWQVRRAWLKFKRNLGLTNEQD